MTIGTFTDDDRVQLDRLEIENFKSYKGNVTIGPLKSFTAVIGPNGSGKSNFMDAISFVFGEQARSLRVKKLNELVHGSNVNDPAAKTCSVTAVLRIGEEDEKRFQRTVRVSAGTDATSEYRIDGKSVSNKQYIESLEEYNIVIKPRNFLVFQGQVELIATMDPKQRTQLIEKISGSGDLKDDYERLAKEQEAAQEEMRKAFNNKKEVAVEEKEAKEEKKLADDYDKRLKELQKERSTLQQFEIYHKEREMDDIKKEVRRQKQAADALEDERKEMEDRLKKAKGKAGEKNKQLNKLDQEIRNAEGEVSKAKPNLIALKAKIEHLQQKDSADVRMLETLISNRDQAAADIARLEEEIHDVKQAKEDFQESVSSQTQESQHLTQLSPAQLNEYHRLKQEVARQMKDRSQEMELLRQTYRKDQESYKNEQHALEECNNELKRKRKEKTDAAGRMQRLQTHIQDSEENRDKLKADIDELKESTENIEPRMIEIQERLQNIAQKLAEFRVDERETARKAKKEELINKLRQLYGDEVIGRLVDLCHHSHERYQLAVTKILGKYMNAIVVTTRQIATQCIAYMKQQEIEPEQFLPLDNLEIKPIAEHLRSKDPDRLKLVIDVIQVTHHDKQSVMKALKFACSSSLTCQDAKYARELAYSRDRYQVVTWTGTLFDKSGIISGGAAELKARAKRWDEKELNKLRTEQTKLTDELRALMVKQRKEAEIREMEPRLKGMSARLKYAQKEMEELEQQQETLGQNIEQLEAKAATLADRVKAAQKKVLASEKKKNDLQAQLNTLEDDIFAEFCQDVGVPNIRRYEEREESERQQRTDRVFEFDQQINKLNQKLIFEKQQLQKLTDKVEKCEKGLEKLRKDLDAAQEDEKAKEKIVEAAEKVLEDLKEQRNDIKKEADERESEADELKKEFASITKKHQTVTRQIAAEETKREQLRLERRAILQHCKMHNITLPFERGSMEDINVAVVTATQDASMEQASQESINTQSFEDREANIKIDYSGLPERLKRQFDAAEHRREVERMQRIIKEAEAEMDKLALPKANASERLGEIKTKVRQFTHELDEARERVVNVNNQFDEVKRERYKKFTECLDTIANSIDQIYKELVDEKSAQAFLNADNQESPFSGGVNLSLVVPGKNYRTIESLSGGEKTLASLSLLFAIHAAHPSPFFIMDEIDAALDNANIGRVAQFMRKKSRDEFQIIIISLKEEMYQHVDALVGIYPEPGDVCISRNMTLDLNQYDRVPKSKK
ncbi:structural maintenance of chromosomes protein 1A-like [Paramacrobiotus metropolitanus]|uniref:structural maintenance of chromosomes protein 1A-like n=1 Tax=Paramacrobiotus metropolitanus TaxID=2943436 RepID=UPI00244630B7|nr:structural maintenance of chromosomes protein 1A-like [Paramacrobiotus metropolitanus]